MWWQEHWRELVALILFAGHWADMRRQVRALTAQVVKQNSRIGKTEDALHALREEHGERLATLEARRAR